MRVQDLVGSKVTVKQKRGPEHVGYISSVPKPADDANIQDAISASIFRIDLASGDVLQTSGMNITAIENDEYVRKRR